MSKRILPILLLIAAVWCADARAQNLPSVKDLIKQNDRNGDGKLAAQEVKGSSFARQFPRWDADADGLVTADEIIKFRARFGIAADGSRLIREPTATMLPIPSVQELKRVESPAQLTHYERQNSAYILKTVSHATAGDRYVVVTDHTEAAFLDPLRRLADHHGGIMLTVDDLATLHRDSDDAEKLLKQLRTANPKYVAIAPRLDSLRENMLLQVWELLAAIDADPQLDAYPGLLVASSGAGLARLVAQSIEYRPRSRESLKPMAISQVPSGRELRSLQKAAILRRYFDTLHLQTPVVGVYTAQASAAPRLEAAPVWNLTTEGRGRFIESFPDDIRGRLNASNLLIMHGHGSPGMSCSVGIAAIPEDFSGKLLLTGSCFSMSPKVSDLAKMSEAPGGYAMTNDDAFVLRAIDRGAVAAFGHMRASSGFPHLFPVLESWLRGETIGESYQELINALIQANQFDSHALVMDSATLKKRSPRQNMLLYVVVGDPALQPFEKGIGETPRQ